MREKPAPWTPQMNAVEAERIVLQQTPELLGWLVGEGLAFSDARAVPYGTVMGEANRNGTAAFAKAWHDQAKIALVRARVTNRPKVAAKIANWFFAARMKAAAAGGQLVSMAKEPADLSHLQPHVEWAINHPKLRMRGEERSGCCPDCKRPFIDPMVLAMSEKYERENPAPNAAALLTLQECIESDKFRQKMIEESSKPKKATPEATVDETTKTEQKRVSGLKDQLAEARKRATMPSAGV